MNNQNRQGWFLYSDLTAGKILGFKTLLHQEKDRKLQMVNSINLTNNEKIAQRTMNGISIQAYSNKVLLDSTSMDPDKLINAILEADWTDSRKLDLYYFHYNKSGNIFNASVLAFNKDPNSTDNYHHFRNNLLENVAKAKGVSDLPNPVDNNLLTAMVHLYECFTENKPNAEVFDPGIKEFMEKMLYALMNNLIIDQASLRKELLKHPTLKAIALFAMVLIQKSSNNSGGNAANTVPHNKPPGAGVTQQHKPVQMNNTGDKTQANRPVKPSDNNVPKPPIQQPNKINAATNYIVQKNTLLDGDEQKGLIKYYGKYPPGGHHFLTIEQTNNLNNKADNRLANQGIQLKLTDEITVSPLQGKVVLKNDNNGESYELYVIDLITGMLLADWSKPEVSIPCGEVTKGNSRQNFVIRIPQNEKLNYQLNLIRVCIASFNYFNQSIDNSNMFSNDYENLSDDEYQKLADVLHGVVRLQDTFYKGQNSSVAVESPGLVYGGYVVAARMGWKNDKGIFIKEAKLKGMAQYKKDRDALLTDPNIYYTLLFLSLRKYAQDNGF